jgi:hypothetical protein
MDCVENGVYISYKHLFLYWQRPLGVCAGPVNPVYAIVPPGGNRGYPGTGRCGVGHAGADVDRGLSGGKRRFFPADLRYGISGRIL